MPMFLKLFKAFFLALGLLTRIPIPFFHAPCKQVWGYSALAYPLVGLLLGAILASMASLPLSLGADLHAALLLTLWVWITGGLHLDGLADTTDAWVGGMGNRARTLEIMKDPRSGPMAITTVMLLLLLKFAAIKTVLLTGQAWLLFLPPLLGRSGLLLLFLTVPYVRAQGMGVIAAQAVPKKGGMILLILMGAALLFLFRETAAKALLFCVSGFFLIRKQMLLRLGGTTGDTAGALCELLETIALLSVLSYQ